MKTLLITLSFIFALGANAQTQKTVSKKEVTTITTTPEISAKKNVADLVAFTAVDGQTQSALNQLFITKYKMLTESGELSAERKGIVSESISMKLESILGTSTFAKVKANTKLYESLIK